MSRPARVTKVDYLGGRVLRLAFSDGLVRELDFAGSVPGVLATVDDDSVFATAAVDPIAGTLSWPTGVDLDPDVLHGDHESAGAVSPRLVSEYRLQDAH